MKRRKRTPEEIAAEREFERQSEKNLRRPRELVARASRSSSSSAATVGRRERSPSL